MEKQKYNKLCVVGFLLTTVSIVFTVFFALKGWVLLLTVVAFIVGFVLSVMGVDKAAKTGEKGRLLGLVSIGSMVVVIILGFIPILGLQRGAF